MALTVQAVIDDVSDELDSLIDGSSGSGAAFNLLVRWVDQTHKDLLHTGLFKHMLRTSTTVTSVAGTRSYTITPTNIRRVEAVYDNASEQFLSPLENVFPGLASVDDLPRATRQVGLEHRASTPYPQYYWLQTIVTTGTNAHTLHLLPPPYGAENAGTVTVYYAKAASTVSAGATALDIGEDGRDAIVAGVLARAFSFLYIEEKAQFWARRYEELKYGERLPGPLAANNA